MIFILGIGRSGTSLLNQVLNAHAQCLSTPESKFILTFYEKYAHQTIDKALLLRDVQQYYSHKLRADALPTVWTFEQTQFERDLAQLPQPLQYAQVCQTFLLNMHYLGRNNAQVRCIADKNPAYVPHIPQLLHLFPHAKFIVTLRDYRAILNSDKQSKGARFITPIVRLLRWRYHFAYLDKLQQTQPDRFLWVKYEDLVSKPKHTLLQICQFLSIPFQENMLQSHHNLSQWLHQHRDTLIQNARQWKKYSDLARPINAARLYAWRENLNSSEIGIAEWLCGDMGKKLGYPSTLLLNIRQKIGLLLRYLPQLLYAFPIFYIFAKLYFFIPLSWRITLANKIKH
jgi:hypothetical protein